MCSSWVLYVAVYMLLCISSIQPGTHYQCVPWIFSGYSLSPAFWTFLYCWVQEQSTSKGSHCTQIQKEWGISNQTGLRWSMGNFLSRPGNVTIWKIFGSTWSITETIAKMLTCKKFLEVISPVNVKVPAYLQRQVSDWRTVTSVGKPKQVAEFL